MHGIPDNLIHPWSEPPEFGGVREIAPGILWLRLALPFRLNHVNIYLMAHENGWAVVDTGFGTSDTKTVWEQVFRGPMKSAPINQLIVTHWHPDHAGLAGWLTERFRCPMYMTMIEYLLCLYFPIRRSEEHLDNQEKFLHRHGMDPDVIDKILGRGQDYMRRITGVPPAFHRVSAGDHLTIGGRDFEILTGGGHSPDQMMLVSREHKLFFAADQVLSKISPNVSVHAVEPWDNALGHYLTSLRTLGDTLPDDILVLPGHGLPFYGVKTRIQQLIEHHTHRCNDIEAACRASARTSAEIVPIVFPRVMDPHQMGFAIGEVIAHINHMIVEGRLAAEDPAADVLRFKAVS